MRKKNFHSHKLHCRLRKIFPFNLCFKLFQTNDDDVDFFFKEFETAKKEVFEWIRDEYRLRRMPMRRRRQQREVDAVNGDTWYRNYQIKECQGNNKSSFCDGRQHMKHDQEVKHVPEISDRFGELLDDDKPPPTTTTKIHNDGEKLRPAATTSVKTQHLFHPVSDHRRQPSSKSNYDPIEARLSAKHYLAKEQNAIHEIEMKHQQQHAHLPAAAVAGTDDDGNNDEATSNNDMLNGNQLPATSSNSNFPSFTFHLDTSSGEVKRSSSSTGQQQKQQQKHFDDQLSHKKNDLFDEVNEKLSRSEQQGLETLLRVKRSEIIDVNEINRMMTKRNINFEDFLKSNENGDGKTIKRL